MVSNLSVIFQNKKGIILPIDFHIFQDGYCTTNQISVIAYVMFFDLVLPSARLVLFHRALWPEIEDRVLAADFTNGVGIEWRCHWECRPKKDRKHRKQDTHTHLLTCCFLCSQKIWGVRRANDSGFQPKLLWVILNKWVCLKTWGTSKIYFTSSDPHHGISKHSVL